MAGMDRYADGLESLERQDCYKSVIVSHDCFISSQGTQNYEV